MTTLRQSTHSDIIDIIADHRMRCKNYADVFITKTMAGIGILRRIVGILQRRFEMRNQLIRILEEECGSLIAQDSGDEDVSKMVKKVASFSDKRKKTFKTWISQLEGLKPHLRDHRAKGVNPEKEVKKKKKRFALPKLSHIVKEAYMQFTSAVSKFIKRLSQGMVKKRQEHASHAEYYKNNVFLAEANLLFTMESTRMFVFQQLPNIIRGLQQERACQDEDDRERLDALGVQSLFTEELEKPLRLSSLLTSQQRAYIRSKLGAADKVKLRDEDICDFFDYMAKSMVYTGRCPSIISFLEGQVVQKNVPPQPATIVLDVSGHLSLFSVQDLADKFSEPVLSSIGKLSSDCWINSSVIFAGSAVKIDLKLEDHGKLITIKSEALEGGFFSFEIAAPEPGAHSKSEYLTRLFSSLHKFKTDSHNYFI